MLSNDMSDGALSERVRALSDAELVHGPGEAFEYTDANYDTLGLIVEKVSGQSYETSIRERIFTPLGMSQLVHRPDRRTPIWSCQRAPILVRIPQVVRRALLTGSHAEQLPDL